MIERNVPVESWDEAQAILGVSAGAGEQELRQAYMEKLRLHPPDRDPEIFEKIRNAYDLLRDPLLRARQVLYGHDPLAPLADLLKDTSPQRRFVGVDPWLAVLKEKRS